MEPTEQTIVEEVVDQPVFVASAGPAETDLYRYAELGAQVRLGQLETERLAILRTFPSLNGGERPSVAVVNLDPPRRRLRRVAAHRAAPARAAKTKSGREPMSEARRKAISKRMKKYWAEQRNA